MSVQVVILPILILKNSMFTSRIPDAKDLLSLRVPVVDSSVPLPTIVKEECDTLTRKPIITVECETANQKVRSRNTPVSTANQVVTQATVEWEERPVSGRSTIERQNTAPAEMQSLCTGAKLADPLNSGTVIWGACTASLALVDAYLFSLEVCYNMAQKSAHKDCSF